MLIARALAVLNETIIDHAGSKDYYAFFRHSYIYKEHMSAASLYIYMYTIFRVAAIHYHFGGKYGSLR